MSNDDLKLSPEDIEYVADMLRAILWVKDDLAISAPKSSNQLPESLAIAEACLRRVALEMKTPLS